MSLSFPPILQPTSADAQQAVNATQAWRAAVEGYVSQVYGRREHLLTPSDFACVADGPFKTTVHYNGLCLESLYFHWLGKQTAYAMVAHSSYILPNTPCEAVVTLAWIPRTSGLLQFNVWLGDAPDAGPAHAPATAVGTISHGGSAGHWTCSHATIATPVSSPGAPMVLTLSNELGNNVDLVAASVSVQPVSA